MEPIEGIVEAISAYNEKFKNRGIKIEGQEGWINTPGMSREDSIKMFIDVKKGDKVRLHLNVGGKVEKTETLESNPIGQAPPENRESFVKEETARLSDAMKISHDAITTSCPKLCELLTETNPGAILESIERAGVSVYITMNQRGAKRC